MQSKHFLIKKSRINNCLIWCRKLINFIGRLDKSFNAIYLGNLLFYIRSSPRHSEVNKWFLIRKFDAYSFSVKANQSTDIATFWYIQALVSKVEYVHPRGCARQSFEVQESHIFLWMNTFKVFFFPSILLWLLFWCILLKVALVE